LRSMGIQPDVIIARSDQVVPIGIRDKIALFCDVEQEAVIPMETVDSIYDVPNLLEDRGLGDHIVERMDLPATGRDLSAWQAMVEQLKHPERRVEVAVVGKYVELRDAYLSVKEALVHSGTHHRADVAFRWIHAEELERKPAATVL